MSDETTPVAAVTKTPPAPGSGGILLPPNLAGLTKLAATEGGRFAMNGVLLEITPEGYRAVATNGKVLGVIEGPPVDTFAEYPALPGLAQAANGATSGIIPSDAWAAGFKMIPKRAVRINPILNSLACILGKNEVNFGATDLESAPTSYNRLLEGRFPDYRQVFPKNDPVVTITVDPRLLIEVLKVAAAVADADNCQVTLSIVTPKVPMRVEAKNGTGQSFQGLIMPLT